MTERLQRLAALSEAVSGSDRIVRLAEVWGTDEHGFGKLERTYDLHTGDLAVVLELLLERRELRARCLEALAAQFDNERLTDAFDRVFGDEDSVGSRWCKKKAGGGVYGDHRVARLLLSWADGIRTGRIK